jgi:hypothetical protein
MKPVSLRKLRKQAESLYADVRKRLSRAPVALLCAAGFLGLAAILFGLHSAWKPKDANLLLKVQHNFRSADFSLYADSRLVYSTRLRGAIRKRLGLIPESVQGSLSQTVPLPSGEHTLRVRVVSDDGAQESNITGKFEANTERELLVSARHGGVTMTWTSAAAAPIPAAAPGWFERYAGALFLTIAGSIISAITGFALRELPGYLKQRAVSRNQA